MLKRTKLTAIVLVLMMVFTIFASNTSMVSVTGKSVDDITLVQNDTYNNDSDALDADKTPKQVNAHMGDNPSTQINITYTTIAQTSTKIVYNKVGETIKTEATGTNSQGASDKYFHKIQLLGLTPNTQYEYTVGEGANNYTGKFKTAPAAGSRNTFKFAYLADTQVSNDTTAKALGATLEEVSKSNCDFVYLAGDHTNTATNETQWELLFNNSGAFPNGGQNMYGNKTVAFVQGNHDNDTFTGYVNAPATAGEEAGKVVYSYDYGPATFIMLNLETARRDETARAKQAEFLRTKSEDANARGQWIIVGFHKSIYTGASHITDADVIEARKYWSPIFAELDVDLVLQGHDHVYSRGFVNASGEKAIMAPAGSTVANPSNAPMYMVGGHAGGLKWYSQIPYTVGAGDPLVTNYAFLDKNSTDDQGDIKQEQNIVEIEMSNSKFTVNAYMLKYDTATDTISTPKYLYDTVTVTRTVPTVKISSKPISVDIGKTVTLKAVFNPQATKNQNVTWKSSNPAVATVSNTGVVTGQVAGTATITVTAVNGGSTDTCQVTVNKPATEVKITNFKSNSKITIGVNEKITLKTKVTPNDTTDSLSFKSSNNSVKINSKGIITGNKVGTSTITVKAGNKTDKLKVTVKAAPKKITAKKKDVTLKKGKTFQIKYNLTKNSASYKVTFSSDKKNVATITNAGKITAKRKGTARITVKTFNGKKAYVNVKVQ